MPTKKVRFTVKYGGETCQLFSVEERGSGDLMIFTNFAKNYEWSDTVWYETLEERYSVHVSPSSPGRLVKKTVSLEGARRIENGTYYLPGKDGFVAAVILRTVPELNHEKYLLKKRPADVVVPIYETDISEMTMVYSILVTDSFANVAVETDFTCLCYDFSVFRLVVLSGMFPVTPLDGYDMLEFPTSTPKYYANQEPLHLIADRESHSLQDTINWVRASTHLLAHMTMARHERLVFEDGLGLDGPTREITSKLLEIMLPSPTALNV